MYSSGTSIPAGRSTGPVRRPSTSAPRPSPCRRSARIPRAASLDPARRGLSPAHCPGPARSLARTCTSGRRRARSRGAPRSAPPVACCRRTRPEARRRPRIVIGERRLVDREQWQRLGGLAVGDRLADRHLFYAGDHHAASARSTSTRSVSAHVERRDPAADNVAPPRVQSATSWVFFSVPRWIRRPRAAWKGEESRSAREPSKGLPRASPSGAARARRIAARRAGSGSEPSTPARSKREPRSGRRRRLIGNSIRSSRASRSRNRPHRRRPPTSSIRASGRSTSLTDQDQAAGPAQALGAGLVPGPRAVPLAGVDQKQDAVDHLVQPALDLATEVGVARGIHDVQFILAFRESLQRTAAFGEDRYPAPRAPARPNPSRAPHRSARRTSALAYMASTCAGLAMVDVGDDCDVSESAERLADDVSGLPGR